MHRRVTCLIPRLSIISIIISLLLAAACSDDNASQANGGPDAGAAGTAA
jgi:hypothetical protein